MATRSSSIYCSLTVAVFIIQGLFVIADGFSLRNLVKRSLTDCPEGWDAFNNKCYRMLGTGGDWDRKTWNEANASCTALGSTLVSIHNEEEQRHVASYFRNTEYDIWIGLYRPSFQRTFQWTDGSPVDYTHWADGEPNYHGANEECVHLNYYMPIHGTWNDHRCSRRFPYVCQTNPTGRVILGPGACGGTFVAEQGVITSPGYPNKYEANLDCEWNITVPSEYQVALIFTNMEVEKDISCRYDYVEVLDGLAEDSPVLGKFCGDTIPDVVVSSGNTMTVRFKSDTSFQDKGFTAEFKKDYAIRVEMESLFNKIPKVVVREKYMDRKTKDENAAKKKALRELLAKKFVAA